MQTQLSTSSFFYHPFKGIAHFTIKFISLFLLLSFSACDLSDDNYKEYRNFPSDEVLYVSMQGLEKGIYILNPNTFEVIDSLVTSPGSPAEILLSTNYKNIYGIWDGGEGLKIYSYEINPLNSSGASPLSFYKAQLIKNADEKYLIAGGYLGIDIFDRQTMTLLRSDPSLGSFVQITESKNKNLIYYSLYEGSRLRGFGIYDLEKFKIIDTLNLPDNQEWDVLDISDMLISHDEKYLFMTTKDRSGISPSRKFIVINIPFNKIENEFSAGVNARLAISPNGENVYISDRGSDSIHTNSSGNMWRYDIKSRKINTIITGMTGIDRITVGTDNRTIFVSAGKFPMQLPQGGFAFIVKADGVTGEIINFYNPPYVAVSEFSGYITKTPMDIIFGKYFQPRLKN